MRTPFQPSFISSPMNDAASNPTNAMIHTAAAANRPLIPLPGTKALYIAPPTVNSLGFMPMICTAGITISTISTTNTTAVAFVESAAPNQLTPKTMAANMKKPIQAGKPVSECR